MAFHPRSILCITFTKAAAANMANRVFDEAAALDRAHRRRSSMPRSRAMSNREPGCIAAGAGAAALRHGAGDPGRPEGADSARLLHAAAAAVPVRGQYRLLVSRCWTRRRRRSCSTRPAWACCWKPPKTPESPLGRALATAIAGCRRPHLQGSGCPKRSASAIWFATLDRFPPAASMPRSPACA